MSDYISREALLEDFESCNADNPRWTPQRVKTLLLRQPAADVAEVVRCRDCRYFKMYKCRMGYSNHDDYCSHGERRGGDNDNVSD